MYLFCDNRIVEFFILDLFLGLFSTELRKKARQLENEIDLKLVSFSKLGTNYSHRDGFKERYSFFEMKRRGFYHLRI